MKARRRPSLWQVVATFGAALLAAAIWGTLKRSLVPRASVPRRPEPVPCAPAEPPLAPAEPCGASAEAGEQQEDVERDIRLRRPRRRDLAGLVAAATLVAAAVTWAGADRHPASPAASGHVQPSSW